MRAFFGSSREGGVLVSLSRNGRVMETCAGDRSADLLELFEKVLKTSGIKKKAVTEIVVDRGPDGFSSVRRRVAIAAALSRALGAGLYAAGEMTPEEAAALPSSLCVPGATVQPLYAAEPNITTSKKKKTWSAR